MAEFVVLYTHQKTKKAKTWQDGLLQVLPLGKKAVLYDDKRTKLDTVFVSPDSVRVGEQLESDKYLILVEEQASQAPGTIPLPSSAPSQAAAPPPDRSGGDASRSGEARVGGLKRRRKDFVPPRMVRPPVPQESMAAAPYITSAGFGGGHGGFPGLQPGQGLGGGLQQSAVAGRPTVTGVPGLPPAGAGVAATGRVSLWSTIGANTSSLSPSVHLASPGLDRPPSVTASPASTGNTSPSVFPSGSTQGQTCSSQDERMAEAELYSVNQTMTTNEPVQQGSPMTLLSRQTKISEGDSRQIHAQRLESGLSRWEKYEEVPPPVADEGDLESLSGMGEDQAVPDQPYIPQHGPRASTALVSGHQSGCVPSHQSVDVQPQVSVPVKRSAAEVLALLRGKKRRVEDAGEVTPASPDVSAPVSAQGRSPVAQTHQRQGWRAEDATVANQFQSLARNARQSERKTRDCSADGKSSDHFRDVLEDFHVNESLEKVVSDSGSSRVADTSLRERYEAVPSTDVKEVLPTQNSSMQVSEPAPTHGESSEGRQLVQTERTLDADKEIEAGTKKSSQANTNDVALLEKRMTPGVKDDTVPDDFFSACFDMDFPLSPEGEQATPEGMPYSSAGPARDGPGDTGNRQLSLDQTESASEQLTQDTARDVGHLSQTDAALDGSDDPAARAGNGDQTSTSDQKSSGDIEMNAENIFMSSSSPICDRGNDSNVLQNSAAYENIKENDRAVCVVDDKWKSPGTLAASRKSSVEGDISSAFNQELTSTGMDSPTQLHDSNSPVADDSTRNIHTPLGASSTAEKDMGEGTFFEEWVEEKAGTEQIPSQVVHRKEPLDIQRVPDCQDRHSSCLPVVPQSGPVTSAPTCTSRQPRVLREWNQANSGQQMAPLSRGLGWPDPQTPQRGDGSSVEVSAASEKGVGKPVAVSDETPQLTEDTAERSVPAFRVPSSTPWTAGRPAPAVGQTGKLPGPSRWEKFLPDDSDDEEGENALKEETQSVRSDLGSAVERNGKYTLASLSTQESMLITSHRKSGGNGWEQENDMETVTDDMTVGRGFGSGVASAGCATKLNCTVESEGGSGSVMMWSPEKGETVVIEDSPSMEPSPQPRHWSLAETRPPTGVDCQRAPDTTMPGPSVSRAGLTSCPVLQSPLPRPYLPFQGQTHSPAGPSASPRDCMQASASVPFSPEIFSTLPPASPPLSLSPLSPQTSEGEATADPAPRTPRMPWGQARGADACQTPLHAMGNRGASRPSSSGRGQDAGDVDFAGRSHGNGALGSTPGSYHRLNSRRAAGQFETPSPRVSDLQADFAQERTPASQTPFRSQSRPGQFKRPRPAGTPVHSSPSWSGSQSCGVPGVTDLTSATASPTLGTASLHSAQVLTGDLRFPGRQEVEGVASPCRQVVIPVSFPTVAQYRHVFSAAVREHLNITLFDLAKTYHSALSKVDLSALSSDLGHGLGAGSAGAATHPACLCGNPSKLVQVKKAGPNQGRFFLACSAPRQSQCKFFQWADQTEGRGRGQAGGVAERGKVKVTDSQSLATYCRAARVLLYPCCTLVRKSADKFGRSSVTKAIPAWVRARQQQEVTKKSMFLRLSRRDGASFYAKDDLWVVSRELSFDPSVTFLAKSVYFGPSSQGEVELEPLSGYSPSSWPHSAPCHAVLASNAATEFACLENLHQFLQPASLSILSSLLHRGGKEERKTRGFSTPFAAERKGNLCVPGELVRELAAAYVEKHGLNEFQAEALHRVAAMMSHDQPDQEPLLLVHGVFGAGKSFLLSVMIQFLVEVFRLNDAHSPGPPFPWKVLVSSTTNVAVDRVLLGLLNLGFDDFVRVGSVKKIAKPVLPYSVHAAGTDSQELRDLQEMLKGDLTPSEKQFVRKTIEKQRLGENKRRLGEVRVVGVTCAATCFSCLQNASFPFVVLDECSQMTEPSSMLPIARFGCHKLLLVGDPKQLDPTIQGSEASHNQGLEQTLFDRTMSMGYEPVMLRTQYRCHPVISQVANQLFYSGLLRDGVSAEDRPPLLVDFPTLSFLDVGEGREEEDGSGSYYNMAEASLLVLLIRALVQGGVPPHCVGVITLYKAQMYKVIMTLAACRAGDGAELKGVQVSTVDAFQGGERDVILLSSVRTDHFGFIDCSKRMNVALTRAKNHLFIVGNLRNLSRNDLWSKVIAHCKAQPQGLQTGAEARVWLERMVEDSSSTEPTPSPDQQPPSSADLQPAPRQRGRAGRHSQKSPGSAPGSYSPPMSLSDVEDFESGCMPDPYAE